MQGKGHYPVYLQPCVKRNRTACGCDRRDGQGKAAGGDEPAGIIQTQPQVRGISGV